MRLTRNMTLRLQMLLHHNPVDLFVSWMTPFRVVHIAHGHFFDPNLKPHYNASHNVSRRARAHEEQRVSSVTCQQARCYWELGVSTSASSDDATV